MTEKGGRRFTKSTSGTALQTTQTKGYTHGNTYQQLSQSVKEAAIVAN